MMAAPAPGIDRRSDKGLSEHDVHPTELLRLDQMEGSLAAQQFIQQQIRKDPSAVEAICACPEKQDKAVWQYEHLRQFTLQLNFLAARLGGACTRQTCPMMKATNEWVYLCAAHKQPQECCAIDYIVHTLDSTCTHLNSSQWFPSRVSIPPTSARSFQNLVRRLYRVFAHAFFHHRDIFDAFEADTHLCERFVVFAQMYRLMSQSHMVIPVADVCAAARR